MAFGGIIFNRLPRLRLHISGYFLGERVDDAVERVEHWLDKPGSYPALPAKERADQAHKETLDHFRERQGLIEAEVWQLRNQPLKISENYTFKEL